MFKYIKRRWKSTLSLVLIIVIAALSQVISAYMIGSSFNSLLANDFNGFIYFGSMSLLCFFIFLLFTSFRIRYENIVNQKIISDIRADIMNTIASSQYEEFYKREIGTYISWLNNDLLIIEQKGLTSLFQLITVISQTVLSTIALISFHWSILVLTLITFALTLYLPRIMDNRVAKSSSAYSLSLEKATSKYSNYLNGFDTLLAYKKLYLLKDVSRNISKSISKSSDDLRKDISMAAFLGGICNLLSQVGILALSGFLISLKLISFGALLTVESLTSTIFNALSNILSTLLNLKVVKPLFVKIDNFTKEIKQTASPKTLVNNINNIELSNLSYKYDDKTVIADFNYSFEKNKKYALVGKSGSGKTTLLNILSLRLNDYIGEFKINGLNVKDLDKDSLFKSLAYVSQNSYIFSESLRFNLSLGDNIDDEIMIKILKDLDLGTLLENEGLDLILEENGKNLSGGQKQRIALARALIRNKPILLLDEVTSSLDKENASLIENMVLANKDLTVILISHNLSEENKERFDQIINFPVNSNLNH